VRILERLIQLANGDLVGQYPRISGHIPATRASKRDRCVTAMVSALGIARRLYAPQLMHAEDKTPVAT
jgi:hypothetical protein